MGGFYVGMSVRSISAPVEDLEGFAAEVQRLVSDGWRVAAAGFDRGVFSALMVEASVLVDADAPAALADVQSAAPAAPVVDDDVDDDDEPVPAVSALGAAIPDEDDDGGDDEFDLDAVEPAVDFDLDDDDADDDSNDEDLDDVSDDDEFDLADIDLDDLSDDDDDDDDDDADDDAGVSGNDAAGWYDDPSGRHTQRYWDGNAWTEHVADEDGNQSTDPPIA